MKKKRKFKKVLVPGFEFGGLHCGIKDNARKKDLGVIFATENDTKIAGVFTQNAVCAAPVLQCQKNIKKGSGRLVVINSGIANAATGKRGQKAVEETVKTASKTFDLPKNTIFVCSTGKIGEHIPIKTLQKGVKNIRAQTNPGGFYDCAEAICTTDQYIKTQVYKGRLQQKDFTIAVMAKGAGMICPNMATMLCYIVTDLNISRPTLQKLLTNSVEDSLNQLSVDGDSSTNDTVLMMASGLCGNKSFTSNSADFKKIQGLLTQLLEDTALMIARDGEGATKAFRVHVKKARTKMDAQKAAKAVAKSLLVKTALFGNDPNWGRILCAVGYSETTMKENKTQIFIGPHKVFSKGTPLNKNESKASAYLKKNDVVDLHIDLNLGKASSTAFGSDLTYDYVNLNAEYRT